MSTAAKRFWRLIDLRTVTLMVWVLNLTIIVWYWPAVCWAVRALPEYHAGSLGSTKEMLLAVQAEEMLNQPVPTLTEDLRQKLEQSLNIDPNSQALRLNGELHLRRGNFDEALTCFTRFLEIDPNEVEPYLRIAEIHRLRKNPEQARAVLQAGKNYFERAKIEMKPLFDSDASVEENAKAVRVARQLTAHSETLNEALKSVAP